MNLVAVVNYAKVPRGSVKAQKNCSRSTKTDPRRKIRCMQWTYPYTHTSKYIFHVITHLTKSNRENIPANNNIVKIIIIR